MNDPSTADQAKQQVNQVADQAQQQASHLVDTAQKQAMSQAATQKSSLAQGIAEVASAVEQVGQQLRQKDQDQVAHYAETAANQLHQLSSYFRQQEVSQIFGDAQEMIRRRPPLVLGGAVVLGFLGARFLKSSSPSQSESMKNSGDTGSLSGRYPMTRPDRPAPVSPSPSYVHQPRFGSRPTIGDGDA
jgi:hypothetical protein